MNIHSPLILEYILLHIVVILYRFPFGITEFYFLHNSPYSASRYLYLI